MSKSRTLERIEREAGISDLTGLLAGLPPTDLQSLMLEVYRLQAQKRTPAAVLADYESNRFVRPSSVSPLRLLGWERVAFSALPPEFEALALAPVAPLGTNSAIALVDQNKALSTSRNTEVVSDSTNVLALECAVRRKRLLAENAKSAQRVHLAAGQRVLRTQDYGDPRFASHFDLFALCSAGRNQDNARFELETFALHAGFCVRALRAFLGSSAAIRFALTDFSRRENDFVARLFAGIQRDFPDVECLIDSQRESGRDYYLDYCFHVYARMPGGDWLELIDGGMVNWTQRLLSNAKERCVITGIGSERVAGMQPSPPAPLPAGEG